MDIVNEFNTICNIFIDLLYSFTQDSDLSFYKKAMTQLVKADKLKMIEQFTIHCLIHNEYIQNKDFSYFMNMQIKENGKESLLSIIKIKDIIQKFNQDQINMIFDYLQLLCNFSIEHLNNTIT